MKTLLQLYEDREHAIPGKDSFTLPGYACRSGGRQRVHVLALGDVGSTLTLALRLCGGDAIETIGIRDLDERVVERFETEFNQITMPLDYRAFPPVLPVGEEDLFACDAFVFCASRGVPPVEAGNIDVRMAQLERNAELVRSGAGAAAAAAYRGEFFIVSDPVDPLCKAALQAGLAPQQIQGFGLGVMNGRAAYYARRDSRFARYLEEGRAFGPHGEDLVIADSVFAYDDALSRQLSRLAAHSNRATRALGFKPYIAPAVSSGALSILENLRGHWHYSSAWFGRGGRGAFLGMKNRRTPRGLEIENLPLDDRLYRRIEQAYQNLKEIF